MIRTATSALVLFAAGALLGACDELDPLDQGDDFTDDTPIHTTRSVVGIVRDLETRLMIKNAQVCVADHPEIACGISNTAGIYALTGLPADSWVDLRFVSEGHLPLRWTVDTAAFDDEIGLIDADLPSEDLIFAVAGDLGVTLAPGSGVVIYQASEQDVHGLLETSGADDESLGIPFSFFDYLPESEYRPEMGGFLNVPPGDYEVDYEPPLQTICEPRAAGVPALGNFMQAAVVPAEATFVVAGCE